MDIKPDMKTILLYLCTAGALLGLIPVYSLSQDINPVAREISAILKKGEEANVFTCRKERICGISAIPEFYRKRNFLPAWIDHEKPAPQAGELLSALADSRNEGLSPEIYHFAEIRSILRGLSGRGSDSAAVSSSTLAELDVLLTDAFLLYATHLRAGRVDPETVHTAWVAFLPQVDLAEVLSRALATGKIAENLAALTPTHPGYRRLKEALQSYRKTVAQMPWPQLPSGPTLRRGDADPRVSVMRQLLKTTGDLGDDAENEDPLFDEALETALNRFQHRHGLKADGILGKQTLSQLNRPVTARIRQMEINLERWRWLPHDLGARHLLVNIAAFRLDVMEADRSVLDMRVVVGTDYRKTPVFSETLKYLVLNPFWNVPFRIAVKDKLPLIRKDPDYLSKNGFRVFTGWGTDAAELAPESIDWSQTSPGNFPYRLRQDPGPHNALGRIKFMFPNRFAVYLHDTPQQGLFDKTVRTFSSGCIRVEKPLDLAAYLLQGDPDWSREQIEAAIDSGKNRTLVLKDTLPVHLLYWTAWVTPEGTLHFREDIYERDSALERALDEGPPIGSQAGRSYQ